MYLHTLFSCFRPVCHLLQRFLEATRIDRWIVVNFSARCDTSHISRELINCGRNKGIVGYHGLILMHGFCCPTKKFLNVFTQSLILALFTHL